MNNIAIVNGVNLSPYALVKLKNGMNSLELVYAYAKALPEVEKIILFTTTPIIENWENVPGFIIEVLPEANQTHFLERTVKWAGDCEHIFYFYGDTPFLDFKLTEKMFHNHKKYFAEYSFADGYPSGLTPEIISTTIINRLIQLAPGGSLERDCFFEIIKKDINSFDIETEIAPRDLRMLRVNLFADSKRNFLLLQKLAALDGIDGIEKSEKSDTNGKMNRVDQIMETLVKQPEILRTLPAYYSIQITRDCPQECSYCPYPAIKQQSGYAQEMAVADFKTILEKIGSYSEDAVINLAPWGEPALHSQIAEIIEAVLTYKDFKLIIETAGIGWDQTLFSAIREKAHKPPVWIVSLDAAGKPMYIKLRGKGYEEAYRTAEALLTLFPATCYIQAVRMVDNEDDLEQFYDNWKKKTENIIVQKYDNFCAKLPDKKVTDLSPVKRFPCWHLKRDLTILLDGTVPVCREDIHCKWVLGNIFTDSLETIWEKGNAVYLEHLGENYNTLCIQCDEYYTYNF